jgi:NAD(P)-dependent dehydrogenase (short-subunit alcohol dehydrogenase family)
MRCIKIQIPPRIKIQVPATELAKEALGAEGQKAFAAMTPLQRMADPREIGAVAAFLASSDSSFMTASEVAVDGGLAQL